MATAEVSVDNDDEDGSAALGSSSNADFNNYDNNVEEDASEQDSNDNDNEDDDDVNWWDYSSDESDDSSDEDYTSATTKRARRMHPSEATTATFGTTTIVKGGVYERYNGEGRDDDRWIIQIVGFVGKKLPIRKAHCRIIFHMHSAIRECFPNAQAAANAKGSGSSGNSAAMQIDRSIVMEETVKGSEFLQTLVPSDEDFDVLARLIEFDLKRDRSNKLIAQFSQGAPPKEPFVYDHRQLDKR